MKKTSLILILAILFLVFAFSFVSSADICCVQPLEGRWCQDNIPNNECVSGFQKPTSCSNYAGCKKGVCVSTESGECSSNTFKAYCETQPESNWYDMPKEDIIVNGLKVCKEGCCFYGDSTSLLTFAKCKALSLANAVEVNFDPSITDETTCTSLSGGDEEVACIIANEFFRDCKRTTKQNCISGGGDPHVGLLCTAPQLATDCVRSETTTCVGGKVYFTDSCGNRANIYVESKFTELNNYWTHIKDSNESCTIPRSSAYSSTCGNCNEIEGTICRSYEEAEQNSVNTNLNRPNYGNNVCAAMDCAYNPDGIGNDEIYKHGESWCAEAKGTVYHINITNETGKFLFETQDSTREILTNFNSVTNFKESYNEFNVPGSRYTKLTCIDGNVYEDSCEDFRQEICMESRMDDLSSHKIAKCMKNDYLSCKSKTDKNSCNQGIFCKWIYGYRFDGQEVTGEDDRNELSQGSCVPLFSPGLKTWVSEGDDAPNGSICEQTTIIEPAVYQNSVWRTRKNFADRPLCEVREGHGRQNDATTDCFENCYVIPTYGRMEGPTANYFTISKMKSIHQGGAVPGKKFEEYCISDRRAYYCNDASGEVGGDNADCTKRKQRNLPIFYTNEEWELSVKDRTRSMGDCGYKLGIFMEDDIGLDKNLESVWAVFKKIKQHGDIKKTYDMEKVYEKDFEFVGGLDGSGFRA